MMRPLAAVSVSGGKDSTAVALLALEADVDARFVFADTGNEHELTMTYLYDYLPTVLGQAIDTVRANFAEDIARKRRYIVSHWPKKGVPEAFCERALAVLHPTGNPFLDLCMMKGRFPSRLAQFCTQELKRYPLDAWMLARQGEGRAVESWRGIRRDESRNRKDAVEREATPEGWTNVQPIVAWTAEQVVGYIQSKGVELNPLYSLGMGRVGCMPCINCSKDELGEIARRFPSHVDRIREWEALVGEASKHGYATFFASTSEMANRHPREIAAAINIDARVQWAMTSHGGRQLNILRVTEEPAACSSIYGLCE